MNSFHALLMSCSFSMMQICSFHIQVEGIEFNDDVHGKKPITTISLNNSSNDDEEIHLGVNLSTIENPSDTNSTLFTLNTSETKLFYAPAFSLQETDQQFFENNNSSEWQLLDKNISDPEAIQNENLQTTFNTLLGTTTLTLNQVSMHLGTTHVQADTVGINASDNKTGWLFDKFYTTSIPVFENALNLTHEHNIAFEAIQNSSFTLLDSLNNSFQNLCPFYIPHPLTHRIDIQFSVLNESIKHDELLKSFVIYLQRALQEKKCESIVPLSLIYGKYFVYSWTNASVSSEFCNEAMLTHIKNKMFNESQLSISFTKMFLPYFNIQDVAIIKLGICAPNCQLVSSGIVAVIVVLALTVLPCCFLAFFKFIHYRKLKLKNKDLILYPRVAVILDTDCQQSVSKSHEPASVNCAFEPEMCEH